MIPADQHGQVRLGGLVHRDHEITVPLDHADPTGESLQLYAREVVSAEHASRGSDAELPWLLFLQGGPGGASPRPDGATGWIGRAVQDHRVLLLDQRGTGRSSPLNAASVLRRGTPAQQADHLALFRADAIVADAELMRKHLLGPEGTWSLLGQSFGGFCALTYLSVAPQALRAVHLTGGLAPITAAAEEVYRATAALVVRKNAQYHDAFPGDRQRIEAVAEHLRRHEVALPDGSRLTVDRLQGVGMALGSRIALPGLHYLWETAFATGTVEPTLSDGFLADVQDRISFRGRLLYAVLHEPCYAQGAATRWAADRVRDEHPELGGQADPLLLTGETIHRHSFAHDPELRPLAEAADLLAARTDWPPLYDLDQLARNEVPVAAALYTEDLYVEAGLSRATAARVRGTRVYETNVYEHDGLRESADVLDRLLGMTRGQW